jgi:hypothetical protein
MIKDKSNSEVMVNQFKQELRLSHSAIETELLDVLICTAGAWPMSAPTAGRQPPELENQCLAFKSFYLNRNSGHKLHWCYDVGSAEVKVRFSPSQVTNLVVTPYMMLILSCFNGKDILSFNDIVSTIGAPKNVVAAHVLSLAHPKNKVLLKNPNNSTLSDADTFKINDKYSNPARHVQVHFIPSKQEFKKKEDDADQEVEALRKIQYST